MELLYSSIISIYILIIYIFFISCRKYVHLNKYLHYSMITLNNVLTGALSIRCTASAVLLLRSSMLSLQYTNI